MTEPSRVAPSPGPAPIRPKVVYVMGSGRAGSTILGVTLGNCDGAFFVGELDRWLPSGGRPVLGGTARTRFWNEIRQRVEVPDGLRAARPKDTLERAGGPLRPRGWRGRRGLRRRYRTLNAALFGAIAERAGASHVIDTSHFPLRARELRDVEEIDLYLLFITRDPQRMLASFTRTVRGDDPFGRLRLIAATNIDLWVTHLLSIFVFSGHPAERRLFLRYEDFTADPSAALRRIMDVVGLAGELPNLQALDTGLALGGNTLLRAATVSLQGENRRPAGGSRLTELLQAPLTGAMAKLQPALATPGATPPAGGN
jgi:Sulfotransferase family